MLWDIGCFDISVFFKLFDAQIVPVLLCGSELWGGFDCPNVEKVHMYACKRILGLSSQITNHMVYGELGRHHLSILASTKCVKYWLRLNKLSNNRYSRMAYNMLKNMAEEGKKTGPQRFGTYCARMVSPLLGRMDQWETKHVSWLNSNSVLKTASFKIDIRSWNLVGDTKYTELLKVL